MTKMASISVGGVLGVCLIWLTIHISPVVMFHNHFRKTAPKYKYETRYFKQTIDHFSFTSNETYSQRYLINADNWQHGGPIFFYTGNEGDITWFAENTGFMWDIAPEFNALLVFAEHRYYGKSMPFGKDSFKDAAHLGYLTAEQALADFAELITSMKASVEGAKESPVVAFGGSYGGMLASWFRMKYPHVVEGALAASAPIWWFGDLTPCDSYYKTVTNDFVKESKSCASNIRASWGVINKMGSTETGLKKLQEILHLCSPLKSMTDVVTLKQWIMESWGNLAMVDYPYSASFLEPLPAWPIKEVCKHLDSNELKGEDLLKAVTAGLGVYYNSTGTAKCYNISVQDSGDMGDMGWTYQACTEMVMPMCTDGVHDMFEPSPWNLTQYLAGCQNTYKVPGRPNWILKQFGGKNIKAASNIIFSNGLLDPWSNGGVMEKISNTIHVIVIPEGAHHLDLRSANPDDPESVKEAREQEKTIISKWVQRKEVDLNDISMVMPKDLWVESVSVQDEWHMRVMMGFGLLLGITLLLVLVRANGRRHRRSGPPSYEHVVDIGDEMPKK